jgi:hypothetical protein
MAGERNENNEEFYILASHLCLLPSAFCLFHHCLLPTAYCLSSLFWNKLTPIGPTHSFYYKNVFEILKG